MQEAFIDAVVTPVFTVLSKFLPLVKDHCLTPLSINRAFWNSMQNQNLVKTTDIIAFLNSRKSENEELTINKSEQITSTKSMKTISTSVEVVDTPIPGIPACAAIDREATVRKLSLIAFSSRQTFDEETGIVPSTRDQFNFSFKSPRRSLQDVNKKYGQKIKAAARKFIESSVFQAVMLIATFHALFANDLKMAIGDKQHDFYIDLVLFFVLLLFLLELTISIYCIPKYMNFFFWLDLAASITLVLEIGFLMNIGSTDSMSSPGSLGLAKASRAAKAGAKAGRLAKLLRLIRLVKSVKLMKWTISFVRKRNKVSDSEEDTNEIVDMKMSVVGQKMTESITKKVIIAVMMMLLSFSLLELDFTPDARQIQLNALVDYPNSSFLREIYIDSHPNIIRLMGIGEDYIDDIREKELRLEETLVFLADQDPSIFAIFDVKEETEVTAWYSIAMTLIVTSLLAILSLLFSQDAYNIMILPIEKMKFTVQQLSENPLLHIEKMKNFAPNDSNETDILQQAIAKMATLLQIGFGCAGAEIIAKSFSIMGELDPMVPGLRVNAIFGFCDIRDFTLVTEALQEDVMLFVNKIAEILHNCVTEANGAPNKNIGDAFLLVWKLDDFKEGNGNSTQKELFDCALISFQKTICEIRRIDALGNFINEETDTSASWRCSLENFKVQMGFGLHRGWAIEGSIGSKVKVDASYLSPHVNLASRLENATKLYQVPLLMSEDFVTGLTGRMQSTCRRCDRVTFKGCKEPVVIFHQDTDSFEQLSEKPKNYTDLFQATSWNDESELTQVGVDVKEMLKLLSSQKNKHIKEVYEQAFNAYLDGHWQRSKIVWHLWMEKFPGDVIAHGLVSFMMKHNFVCPSKWKGYRELKDKV